MGKLLLIGMVFIITILPLNEFAQTNKIKYEIISKERDNRGLINQLYIYVKKMSDIKDVNKLLFNQYRKAGIVTLQIFYFDDRQIAKIYKNKVFDKNVSDNEIERMGKHLIGKFEYIALGNTQTLHVGKEADLY